MMGEKSAPTIGPMPRRANSATQARPTGPRPSTIAARKSAASGRISLCLAQARFGAAASFAQDGLTESPDGPEAVKVYYTESEALAKVFAKADTVWAETWVPSPEERAELQGRLGWELAEDEFVIHLDEIDPTTIGIGVSTLAVILILRRVNPAIPVVELMPTGVASP